MAGAGSNCGIVALAVAAAAAALAGCAGEERALAEAGGCGPVAALADRDDPFVRLFDGPDLCAGTRRFTDAGTGWAVMIVRSGRPGPLWVLPHDDEDAALVTAAAVQARYGGTVVAVETGGERLNGGIDPNRAFSDRSRACPGGPASPRWTRTVLAERDRRFPIVALHTNRPGTAARGGAGTISIHAVPEGARAFLPPPGVAPVGGEDDLVILASTDPSGDRRLRRDVAALTAAGVPVIVETVDRQDLDCSLSNHAALAGLRPYYNVEVRDGASALQTWIVSIVMEVAGVAPNPAE